MVDILNRRQFLCYYVLTLLFVKLILFVHMAAKSRFFDDAHPRSFPNEKKKLGKVTLSVTPHLPKPTLPGISIIVDKNKSAKVAPKISFMKWKQQYKTLFTPTRFESTNRAGGFLNKRNSITFGEEPTVERKFQLDFETPIHHKNGNQEKHQQLMRKKDCSEFKRFNAKKLEFQSMMTFSQLNRVARSESCNVPPEGQQNSNQFEDCQSNPLNCCCSAVTQSRMNENSCEIANNEQGEYGGILEDHQSVADQGPLDVAKKNDMKSKVRMTNKALVNIVEEQIEIVKQQKQILMQQNEIFKLQHQIEKLVLTSANINDKSTETQQQRSPNCKDIVISPCAAALEKGASQSICNYANNFPTTGKSIGVMTSFKGNLNDTSLTKNDSHKDTMLERINKIINNSPPIINYKSNNGNYCHISPKSLESQTLICKTSTRNRFSVFDPKIADRSYALQLLDMKYHPELRLNQRSDAIEKTKRSSPSSKAKDNDCITLTPDKYDYLIRHGLLKK